MINKFDEDILRKMREIVCFAYNHSPYYRKLYDENGIDPVTVKLPGGLPIVPHTELVKHSTSFRSDIPVFKVCASSGTKNSPKLMFRSEEDFERSVSNQIKMMKWSGVEAGDTVAIAQPFGIWGYGDLTQEASKRMRALAIPLGNVSDEVALEMMILLKANVLDVAPSRLRNLIKLARERNEVGKLQMKSIMSAGEPLTEGLRSAAWQTFGAQIYNQYGSEETDGLGAGKTSQSGIRLFDDDFLFEVLDEYGESAEDGEAGVLVVTSLYHKGTPLIRYELQDIIKPRSGARDEVDILGRKCDYAIIYDSVKLYPYHIENILINELHDMAGWQCIIEQADNQILLTIYVDSPQISGDNIARIENMLSKCSIDIEALVNAGIAAFKINPSAGGIVSTARGKSLKIVDKRRTEN